MEGPKRCQLVKNDHNHKQKLCTRPAHRLFWYGQFFFYNVGYVRLGQRYAFSRWAIHMILLVMFSNLLAARIGL